MKKQLVLAASVICLMGLGSCGNTSSVAPTSSQTSVATFDTSKSIKAYTRDTTSGTRDGFFTKIGLGTAKTDNAPLVSGYVEVSSNGNMISAIQNDEYGIGYISLSTLDGTGLTGLKYENVVPSEANVLNGTYQLTRNFNYVTRNDYAETSKAGQIVKAFVAFLSTSEGVTTIKSKDGINNVTGNEPTWNSIKSQYPVCSEDNSSITVKFGGSTSVEKMAKALTAQFAPLCGNFVPSHNHTGSGDAYKHTQGSGKDDSGALDVGFLSREIELDSAEAAASGTYGKICTDAIVAVVNSVNTYTSTNAASLKEIYTGEKLTWASL